MFTSWTFDGSTCPNLLRPRTVISNPMVDGPARSLDFGRVTLLATRPPDVPRGSNGGPAVLDARALADAWPRVANHRPPSRRTRPRARGRRRASCAQPRASADYLIRRVEELVGACPFEDLDRHITRASSSISRTTTSASPASPRRRGVSRNPVDLGYAASGCGAWI